MAGLINLITQYSSKLSILPVVVVMNIIITILIYFLSKRKIVKFFPSFGLGIIALLLGIYSFNIFTTPRGLDLSWIAVFLGTSALVGLFVCFIIDLIDSIKNTELDQSNTQVQVGQENKAKNKKRQKRSKDKVRVAKKPNKKRENKTSKYHTKKIKADPTKLVKANKKMDIDSKDIIVFESEE